MSFAYDGGQRTIQGGATRRDDTSRDWTPDDRAEHAKNLAGNITRSVADVSAACDRMQASSSPAAQAAAKKEAVLALESLRAAATAAAAAVGQATDPAVAAVLAGANAQLEAADEQVNALPEPAVSSSPDAPGVRRFAAALPPADGPRPEDSPELVQRLQRIIDAELVHGDLDPLKAALAEGGELWPQVARLPEKLRSLLSERLAAVRPRLLTERIDREKAARRRPAAGALAPVADYPVPAHEGPVAATTPVGATRDPLHDLAAMASAQLGIAPRLEVGEAGRAATEARGARGVAHGDAIAIHPDVDPTTPAGKQVVLHEHLHQAQAQLPADQDHGRDAAELEADALASAAANGGVLTRPSRHIDLSRPAGDDDARRARDQGPHGEAAEARVDAALAAAARDGQSVTSRLYLRGHLSEHVLPAIARFVADKRYPLPERLRYVDSDRGVGVEALRLITEVHGADPFYALPQILARVGVDVWGIIDAHRPATAPRTFGDAMASAAPTDSTDLSAGQRGGPGWVDGIGAGIAAGFHRAVGESVTRLGERYVAAYDSNGKDAAESHGLRPNLAVAYHHLSPVVAIDRLVARVMVDDLVRVDPAPAAKPAPTKDASATPTVTGAAQRVTENAGQVEMALALDRRGVGGLHLPPKEIHALRHALDDLATTLHDHARQDRDEVKELDVARAKVESVQQRLAARYGARNAEVSSLARAVGRVWAAAHANQATDAPDTQDERDELASVARESLAMLEGARSMIEQAQGQIPGVYVFAKPIMPAITTTRQWVTELAGGHDAAAAMRLATAIRTQEQFVATVAAELTAVFGEPPTATWAGTVNAYAEVLGQSSLPPDHSARALERARRMRRRLKLDGVAAYVDAGNEAANQVRELDGTEGDAAIGEQRALMARSEQYEERIAAGGVVPQAALDDLALDSREQAFDHRLEVLDQMAKKVRGVAADLQGIHVTRGLALWALQKHILSGVVPRCDALIASLAEVERTTLAARTKASKAARPDQASALRTAAADAAEVQLKTALRDGHYQATLDEARSKIDDAQLVDTIAMLAELIAMTLVGNLAATATSGMARGVIVARASASAERAVAAMEAAGTARELALAEQAGTMLRAEALAARIGGVAGMAAEGVVNSLGQKLQGDDSSLASLIVVNIGTSAALERLVGTLTTLRHAEQAGADAVAEVRKLRIVARKGAAMAKAAATLGAEVVMAAAVDHALSKMVGRASNPPSDQTVAEWLMQGAMMAVGKHLSRNIDTIAHSLEALELRDTSAGADLYARAKRLATRSHELAAGEGAGHSTDVLEQYIQLLGDQTRFLNHELVEAVDHNDDRRRAQIVKALREANRASGQVRDFAQDSIAGATHDGQADRPAAAKPDRGVEERRQPAVEQEPSPPRAPAPHVDADPAVRAEPTPDVARPVESAPDAELPVHERPTGKMEAVAPPPDVASDVDTDTAPRLGPPETLPALQQIEAVTGVTKGPQYEQGMAELRQFYAEMEAEAQHRTPVRNTRKDGGYEWDYGHDSQTFSHGLVNVEFRVHLVRGRGVSDAEIAKLQASVHAGVDKHYNLPDNKVTPRGGKPHRLHVEVVFVDDPARAHLVVSARAGDGQADAVTWFVDGAATTHAHEVGHGAFGLKDEYVDPKLQSPDRMFPNSPGVTNDGSLMGDYWERDPSGALTARPGTELKERHLDVIGDEVAPAAPDRARVRPAAHGVDSADNVALRDYLASLGRSGRAPPMAPASLDHVPALGSFHGQARAEGTPDLSERELRTQIVNEVAAIAPASARLVSDHELMLHPDSASQVVVSFRVDAVPGESVARHSQRGNHEYEVLVSPRARTADVVRALASEVATIDSLARPVGASTNGLEGRVAELRVLSEDLDRSRARGGEHLDAAQIERDLGELLAALGIDRTTAGRERLLLLTASDRSLQRRISMHLDGIPQRPTLSAASDLEQFSEQRRARLDALRTHAQGEGVEPLVASEALALGTQLRLEEGHRIFDGLNSVARPRLDPATQVIFNRQREAFVQILNDSTLTLKARKTLLKAQLENFMSDPGLGEVVHKARPAEVQTAIDSLGDSDAFHGSMHLDVATGRLVVHGDVGQGPHSIRELTAQLDEANQAAADNGLGVEYVVIIHRPRRGADGQELSMVEVAARRRPRSRLPSKPSAVVESQGAGDLIVDIGVGRGSFATELAARKPGDQIVQTEMIESAEVGQMSRDMPGIADAGPLRQAGTTMVFADILGHPELLSPGGVDAASAGTKLMFLNNVSAHLSPREYADLARALMANMADDGVVEIQWTMSPEARGKPPGSRGHIDDRLLDALQPLQVQFGRSLTVSVLEPVPYDYTLNASVRGQADAGALSKYEPPVPEHRIRITFGRRSSKAPESQ